MNAWFIVRIRQVKANEYLSKKPGDSQRTVSGRPGLEIEKGAGPGTGAENAWEKWSEFSSTIL
jgi:hypothetical protein